MKIKLVILLSLIFSCYSNAQSKTFEGLHYKIFVDIPINWHQLPGNDIFHIMPDDDNISELTYIKIIGNDYYTTPNLDKFIEDINKNAKGREKGTKIEKLNLIFKNLKKDNFITGRYKTFQYTYKDRLKVCIVFIECKRTIVEIVFSAEDGLKFKTHFKAFEKIAKSIIIKEKRQTKKN
jgi:hypothetical protein